MKKRSIIRFLLVLVLIPVTALIVQTNLIDSSGEMRNNAPFPDLPEPETFSALPEAAWAYEPFSLETALEGTNAPDSILDQLELIGVRYMGIDSLTYIGQLVVHRDLVGEIAGIFNALFELRFPIEKVIPICYYDWSDDASMQANNTSCFNYRNITGGSYLSWHAFGRAIDINPYFNPFIRFRSGQVYPEGAVYNPSTPGTITQGSEVVRIFKQHGWEWGGDWRYSKDYQHFYKD